MQCSSQINHKPIELMTSKAKEEEEEQQQQNEHHPEIYQHYTNVVSTFPKAQGVSRFDLYRNPDGWHANLRYMVGAMVFRAHFTALSSDVIVTTIHKSGTTWTKALVFAIVHRKQHHHDDSAHPFKSSNPHECVPSVEFSVYKDNMIPNSFMMPEPRLFATHIPFVSLPGSIKSSGCKIIYLCRNPKDVFISLWHFTNKLRVKDGNEPLPTMETALDLFCDGLSPFGPYWDHVLGYWNAHLERPRQVLFLKYEEMRRDTPGHVKKLAEFLGCPFSVQEEEDGVVEGIVRLCGFEHLSGLDVNKDGKTGTVDNSFFFRRGVVGDWENYLSSEMARRLDEITESKFKGSGLSV